MAYDVARVRGLHPALGDGWMRFDAQAGMLIPESVATTVSTAFRGSATNIASPHPSARRSVAVLDAARQAIADLVNGDPAGVVLGADRVDPADLAGRRVVVAGRTGLRGGGQPPRRRGEHRAVAARGQPLRRQGEVGRGRHRDRRAADLAVGEPDHPADPAGGDAVGVRRRWARSPTSGPSPSWCTTSAAWSSSTIPPPRPTGCSTSTRSRPTWWRSTRRRGAVRRSARWCSATRR